MSAFWAAKNFSDPGLSPSRAGSFRQLSIVSARPVAALSWSRRSLPGLGFTAPSEPLADLLFQFQQAQVDAVENQAQRQGEKGQHNEGCRKDRTGNRIDIAHGDILIY